MRTLMLVLPVAVLTLGSIELSPQSAQTKAALSRVHQLEIEDQSENPGIFPRRIITGMGMRAVRRSASFWKRERLPRAKISLTLR
jgi:hypothetical protein